MSGSNPNQFDEVVVIHNVGSVGDVAKSTVEMTDFNEWRKYYDLNVFSPAVLNGVFMELFKEKSIKKHVINITSLCGIQPMKSVGFYCTGKAAREMYFKVSSNKWFMINFSKFFDKKLQIFGHC